MTPERAREMAEFVHDYIENLDNPSAESKEEIIGTLAEAILAADKPVEGWTTHEFAVVIEQSPRGKIGGCAEYVHSEDRRDSTLHLMRREMGEEWKAITEPCIIRVALPPVSVPVVEGRVVG